MLGWFGSKNQEETSPLSGKNIAIVLHPCRRTWKSKHMLFLAVWILPNNTWMWFVMADVLSVRFT